MNLNSTYRYMYLKWRLGSNNICENNYSIENCSKYNLSFTNLLQYCYVDRDPLRSNNSENSVEIAKCIFNRDGLDINNITEMARECFQKYFYWQSNCILYILQHILQHGEQETLPQIPGQKLHFWKRSQGVVLTQIGKYGCTDIKEGGTYFPLYPDSFPTITFQS